VSRASILIPRMSPSNHALASILASGDPADHGSTVQDALSADPPGAVTALTEILVSEDEELQATCLLALSNLRDTRTLPAFESGLKDRRRSVITPIIQTLERMAQTWEPARSLQERFLAGDIAGEVVSGEPVEVLLESMNSPRMADRLRSIQKMTLATDERVDTVLEISLSSRDINVKSEAARALARRHEEIMLPRLIRGLGEAYRELEGEGRLALSVELANELASLQRSRAGKSQKDTDLEIGKRIQECFDGNGIVHEVLQRHCGEIRDVRSSGASLGSDGAQAPAPVRPSRVSLDLTDDSDSVSGGTVSRPSLDADRKAERIIKGAGTLSLLLAFLLVQFWLPRIEPPGDSGSLEESTELLTRMGLVKDNAMFADRFAGKAIRLQGEVIALDEDGIAVRMKSNGLEILVRPATRTDKLPADAAAGKIYRVEGVVSGRISGDTIEIAGHLRQ